MSKRTRHIILKADARLAPNASAWVEVLDDDGVLLFSTALISLDSAEKFRFELDKMWEDGYRAGTRRIVELVDAALDAEVPYA